MPLNHEETLTAWADMLPGLCKYLADVRPRLPLERTTALLNVARKRVFAAAQHADDPHELVAAAHTAFQHLKWRGK